MLQSFSKASLQAEDLLCLITQWPADAVQLLVEEGAHQDAVDTMYHSTPLGWAVHLQAEEPDALKQQQYAAIAAYLRLYGQQA